MLRDVSAVRLNDIQMGSLIPDQTVSGKIDKHYIAKFKKLVYLAIRYL